MTTKHRASRLPRELTGECDSKDQFKNKVVDWLALNYPETCFNGKKDAVELADIDDELALMEDGVKGKEGDTISRIRGLIQQLIFNE